MNPSKRHGSLISIAVAGALIAWAVSQFTREHFNAVALLVAALSFYYIGARFYSGFIANQVVKLDDSALTPAHRLKDHRDFMPFRRWTLFGMHFAWIAGPGPLIGPTLAAQFGFLPGFLWIVLGAVMIGCVQDFVILVFSTRRDGMSLARMVKNEVNPIGGFIASLAVLLILEILLGVLALFVVNALKGSPWGTFTIASSIPIAFFAGYYMTRIRPGHEGQATAIGVTLLILATAAGGWIAHNPVASGIFTLTDRQLSIAVVIYGFMAAALPAWMLLAPRDNISTYLKIGTVFLLAVGIFVAQPVVRMPMVTRFVDGSGPIFGGALFPFCFIVIACGAISGFHSLISSGTTPRFVDKESDMRVVGYGAMLTESFVGVMALIAAVTLVPGVYLAMTMPGVAQPNRDGTMPVAAAIQLTQQISSYGEAFAISPEQMNTLANQVGEKSLYNRAGGAPTLAVGMAHVFSGVLGGGLLAFWYHFAIMFEAVFILTVLDSGTRVIRFVIQELLHDLAAIRAGPDAEAGSHVVGAGLIADDLVEEMSGDGRRTIATGSNLHTSTPPHVPIWLTSGLAVLGWGLILSWGILDTEGGTKALIKMFGTANQLLAVIALTLATVIMLKRHRQYAWVTGFPAIIVGAITLTAAYQSVFHSDPRVGAIAAATAAAQKFHAGSMPAAKAAIAANNAYLTAFLTGLLALLVISVLVISVREIIVLLRAPRKEPVAAGNMSR